MSAPLVPSPLDCIRHYRFAFYPPIKHLPNEWLLGASSSSEVQVINTKSGIELWVPRQYIGPVTEGAGSILTVCLSKELELRSGVLTPRVKRIIEMPRYDANKWEQAAELDGQERKPAAVVGIRVEKVKHSVVSKALVTVGVATLVVSLLIALIFFGINECANIFPKRFGRLSPCLRLFALRQSPATVVSR